MVYERVCHVGVTSYGLLGDIVGRALRVCESDVVVAA